MLSTLLTRLLNLFCTPGMRMNAAAAAMPTVATAGSRYRRNRGVTTIATTLPRTTPIHTERSSDRNDPTKHSAPISAAANLALGRVHVATAMPQAAVHTKQAKPFATASTNGPRPRP